MAKKPISLHDCATAYECRDRLPELAGWMDDDALRRLPIWQGNRFAAGAVYFDLNHPERGAFATDGSEAAPTDRTYVSQSEVPQDIWAMLITWQQPVSESQGDSIARQMELSRPEPSSQVAGAPSAR
jgi:hypothetical protein